MNIDETCATKPAFPRSIRMLTYWCIVSVVVVADQVTKAAVRKMLGSTTVPVIPGIVDFVHLENTGGAFSIGQGATAVFSAISVICLLVTLYVIWKPEHMPVWLVVPVSLVAGGALGNLIDRIIRGSVTDFIATAFVDFPVFNVADMCITIGTIFGLVGYWAWEFRNQANDA